MIVLLCAGQTGGWADSKPLELKWTELAPLIQGRRVELTLAQGTKIKGEAIAVREDTLLLDVKKASKSYEKGNAVIPRASLSLIKVEKKGSSGRVLGTIIGVLTGLVVGGYVAARAGNSAASVIPLFLGMASTATIGGYHAGKGLDKQTTLIRVVPDYLPDAQRFEQ